MVMIGLAIFLVFSALGSYKVFHYTESNEFCGTMCHKVMEPDLESGEETIYKDDSLTITQAQMDTLEFRQMDCLDCHNRPSHDYKSPRYYFDNAITAGRIPKDLPDIKIASMEVLRQDYPTKDSAFHAMDVGIKEYYEFMYEEIYDTNMAQIESSIAVIQSQYALNAFPEMNVKWKDYPNHLGHLESNGCYRCHNDSFKSENGRLISRDCTLCHSIMSQGTPGSMEVATESGSLEFKHPIDIKGKWREIFCTECHKDLYE